MDDGELNALMAHLFRAQSHKCGAPLSEIRVNTETRASDDGCDGWTGVPATSDEWLGSEETCWQFKAGTASQAARLVGEVTKPIPRKTLENGGRFVLVAPKSTRGTAGEEDRRATLVTEARAAGLPTDRIDVLGSERLEVWCNQHPAVASRWAGRPEGLWTLKDWRDSPEHQVPWQASEGAESALDDQREQLDPTRSGILHLHIHGPPGVGKTRFALELCGGAEWSSAVIYVRQAEDVRLAALIDSVAQDAGACLVVVVDEVQAKDLRPLRESVGHGDGRVRIVTIGHDNSPDPTWIAPLRIAPLERQTMTTVIKGWHPSMPREHVDFIVRFADGYVRLARLAADAVARNPTMNVHDLLGQHAIRDFLDSMLDQNRRPLHVVAALTMVGWTGDRSDEGQRIAEHFGLDWNQVRAAVHEFHNSFGIAPRGGRYRYISPTPLGTYLAAEAWEIYPELMRELPNILPREEACDAYYERLSSMASSPQANEFAREELAFFFRLDDFRDVSAVRRWSALASADADAAAASVRAALAGADVAERRRMNSETRRHAVWTLIRLAWQRSSFYDSTMALALLAEAEADESWTNDATREFVARFQVLLGGTATPYLDRMHVLDDLLALERPALTRLVIKALAKVGDNYHSRAGSEPPSDALPELEWRPRTREEHVACFETALAKLRALATTGVEGIEDDLVSAATSLVQWLRQELVRDLVAKFFLEVRESYPAAREPLRREVARLLWFERKHRKKLSASEMSQLEALHAQLEDPSLEARLRQHVGQRLLDSDESPDLSALANELLSNPEVLSREWAWLTSGDAVNAWELGEALAIVDTQATLADVMPAFSGSGTELRILCGYVAAHRRARGDEWYERWLLVALERADNPIPLLFETIWRCGPTERLAAELVRVLRDQDVAAPIVGQLAYSPWTQLASAALAAVLTAMADSGHGGTALAILHGRLPSAPDESFDWKPMALRLATDTRCIRAEESMVEFHWIEVAKTLVADHAGELAAAIIQAQDDQSSSHWFAAHSEASKILHACADHDPSAVWRALRPRLESATAHHFVVGFPRAILDKLPADDVLEWVAADPEERASIVANLASKAFSDDASLAARIVGTFGDLHDVADAFFSAYMSGSWSGSVSRHWESLAAALDRVVASTNLPKLRTWATRSARELREMAAHDRDREEEEYLRRH